MRLAQELPRWLLHAAAAAGLIASMRFALAPPRPLVIATRDPTGSRDLAAEGFASLFAKAYLTWREGDPEARRRALEPFAGSSLAPEVGSEPPSGSQQVLFEQVVAEREVERGLHVYSIAADTGARGLVYLAVPVLRRPDGGLAIGGYPAFVGAPAATPADPVTTSGREVEDPTLRAVVVRALRNYLASAQEELAADLAPGAQVSPPQRGLSLEALQSLTWAPGGENAVVALIVAVGEGAAGAAGGARFTLAYEIGVLKAAGRWELSAIETG
jgi:Conjugative transposon protein TcpC